jgi:hypothetical protein
MLLFMLEKSYLWPIIHIELYVHLNCVFSIYSDEEIGYKYCWCFWPHILVTLPTIRPSEKITTFYSYEGVMLLEWMNSSLHKKYVVIIMLWLTVKKQSFLKWQSIFLFYAAYSCYTSDYQTFGKNTYQQASYQ